MLNSSRIDADRMSHLERSDRAGRQGQRRRHHRWSGPDHFYNDSRLFRPERVIHVAREEVKIRNVKDKANVFLLLTLWLFLSFCLFPRAHVVQHYDGLKASRISSTPVPSEGRQVDYKAMLDELTLKHMTQDCSSLKNQLLGLKTLLQVGSTHRCDTMNEHKRVQRHFWMQAYRSAGTNTYNTCIYSLCVVQWQKTQMFVVVLMLLHHPQFAYFFLVWSYN